ncbi:hypothetical protein RHSP_73442 [Rhizobium freirei PRF 81]|uniref:Uncharacterized protein n=1 Tax=Rhizobium freirei PRF 81 TaxID=363754 RepID=N6UV10_9HYPH|nr:hypothetical protein RHSP_73442 [Rhizobium freirei PRF 81]
MHAYAEPYAAAGSEFLLDRHHHPGPGRRQPVGSFGQPLEGVARSQENEGQGPGVVDGSKGVRRHHRRSALHRHDARLPDVAALHDDPVHRSARPSDLDRRRHLDVARHLHHAQHGQFRDLSGGSRLAHVRSGCQPDRSRNPSGHCRGHRGFCHLLHDRHAFAGTWRSQQAHEGGVDGTRADPRARAGTVEHRWRQGDAAQSEQSQCQADRRALQPAQCPCRCQYRQSSARCRPAFGKRAEHVSGGAVSAAVPVSGRCRRFRFRSRLFRHQAIAYSPARRHRHGLFRLLRAEHLYIQPGHQAPEVDQACLARCPRSDADLRGIGHFHRSGHAARRRRNGGAISGTRRGDDPDHGRAFLPAGSSYRLR